MPEIPFSIGDAVILMILATSIIIGFRRGFILETLSVIAWVGAIVLTLYAFEPASIFAQRYINPPAMANIIAALVVFVVALMLFGAISRFCASRVRASIFGPVDRSLGVVFGILRGAVIISFAYILILLFSESNKAPAWIDNGKFASLTRAGAALLIDIAPPFVERALNIDPTMLDDEGLLESLNGQQGGSRATLGAGQAEGDGTGYSESQREKMDELFEQEIDR